MPSMPPGGFQNEEDYDHFEIEYNEFIVKCGTEGCPSTAAHVGRRSPFQLASLISPLYLLVTLRLSSKSFHHRSIIDLAARLGLHKSPLVTAVESMIWGALFCLSEGRTSAYVVLRDLANSMPWSDITFASACDDDKQCFSPALEMPYAPTMYVPNPKLLLPPPPPLPMQALFATYPMVSDSFPNALARTPSAILAGAPLGNSPAVTPFQLTSPSATSTPHDDFTNRACSVEVLITRALWMPDSFANSLAVTLNTVFGGAPLGNSLAVNPLQLTSPSTTSTPQDNFTNCYCNMDNQSPVDAGSGSESGSGSTSESGSISGDMDVDDHDEPETVPNELHFMQSVFDGPDLHQPCGSYLDEGQSDGSESTGSPTALAGLGQNQLAEGGARNGGTTLPSIENHPKSTCEAIRTDLTDPEESDLTDLDPNPSNHSSSGKDSTHSDTDSELGSEALERENSWRKPLNGSKFSPSSKGCLMRKPRSPHRTRGTNSAHVLRPDSFGSPSAPLSPPPHPGKRKSFHDEDRHTNIERPSGSIDLDAAMALPPANTLNLKHIRSKCIGAKEYRLYGASKDDFLTYTPEFHHEIDVIHFDGLMKAVADDYVDGLPRHLSLPATSSFAIMTAEELAHMDAVIDVQDQSIQVKNGDYGLRLHQGTLKQLFAKGSAGPNDNGRILNALDFPLPTSDLSPDALCTDLHAWIATECLPFCNAHAAPLPSRDLRWGLVATYGALHYGHIDSDGFGTFVNVLVGAKYWFVTCPKQESHFQQTVLKRRMRPQTPHWVVTPKPSICRGGHFYCMSTLTESVIDLYRTWALGGLITNTNHNPSHLLLICIMYLWHRHFVLHQEASGFLLQHIPNLESFHDILTIFILVNVMELLNVVDYQTYKVETNLSGEDLDLPADPGLSQFLMRLQGFDEKVGGAPDCTLKKFTREVKTVLSNSPLLEAATIKIKPVANMIDNFLWDGDEYSIHRRSSQIQCIASKQAHTAGRNQHQKRGLPQAKSKNITWDNNRLEAQ
ncbi:hypothetical protein K443DRAFT_126253 [Laccaria amethystina LaAM-08-1]|uniref:Uncharacterized protein n=1 Tax=Laccaria amethystina LaAM-08-1 TaxID=1095629 RepID=A0A0C9X4D1_9AGAR|nr:hypothetical protein K443DRAFT_126253 [Laccaria amethystina LaAM-08-1]